jgi:hypothetical protein
MFPTLTWPMREKKCQKQTNSIENTPLLVQELGRLSNAIKNLLEYLII